MIEWKNVDSFSAGVWWFHLDRNKGNGAIYRLRLETDSLPTHTVVRVKRGSLKFAKTLQTNVIERYVVNLKAAAFLFKLRPVSDAKTIAADSVPPRKTPINNGSQGFSWGAVGSWVVNGQPHWTTIAAQWIPMYDQYPLLESYDPPDSNSY